MKIFFEDCANYITAENDNGIIVRCNFRYTDCREDESIDNFIKRHGGIEKSIQYLEYAYKDTTNIIL
jgi:hypothetical protein